MGKSEKQATPQKYFLSKKMRLDGKGKNRTVDRSKDIFSTQNLVLIGLMAAIICIAGPESLNMPFTPVPVSLTNLAIYFILYVVGTKRTVISYCIYLLLGFAGLPVFSNFSGGLQKLIGPTGGYLVGFILMAIISGFFIDRWYARPVIAFAGMWAGKVVSATFGTIWLAYSTNLTFTAALAAGVTPFLIGDLVKTIIVAILGPVIRKNLNRAGVVEEYSI